jgi:hypothetical protein
VRNPDPGQSFPSDSFNATCSALNSARISSLVRIFVSRYVTRSRSPEWSIVLFWSTAAARSRRTPYAGDRGPSASSQSHRKHSRPAPCPLNSAAEWRLFFHFDNPGLTTQTPQESDTCDCQQHSSWNESPSLSSSSRCRSGIRECCASANRLS